jgi:hypothetical protein
MTRFAADFILPTNVTETREYTTIDRRGSAGECRILHTGRVLRLLKIRKFCRYLDREFTLDSPQKAAIPCGAGALAPDCVSRTKNFCGTTGASRSYAKLERVCPGGVPCPEGLSPVWLCSTR